jgi:hypothetical protein
MTTRKLGIIGPIIKDVFGHICNSGCRGNIHVIKAAA